MCKLNLLKNAMFNAFDELTPLFKGATFLKSYGIDSSSSGGLAYTIYDLFDSDSIIYKHPVFYVFCFVGQGVSIYKCVYTASGAVSTDDFTFSLINSYIQPANLNLHFYMDGTNLEVANLEYYTTDPDVTVKCNGGSIVILEFEDDAARVDRILSGIELSNLNYTLSYGRNTSTTNYLDICLGAEDKRRKAVFAAYKGNMSVCKFTAKNNLIPIYSTTGNQLIMLCTRDNSMWSITTDGVNRKLVYGATIIATPAE